MNQVFIDTNVILDYVLIREHGKEAKSVVAWLVENKIPMMMSLGGFYTMHYLIDKYLRQTLQLDKARRDAPLRTLLTRILQTFTVAEHDNASLLRDVGDPQYTDLEDSCQYQLALRSGCDILVTFNDKDFHPTGALQVVNPQQFINTYVDPSV